MTMRITVEISVADDQAYTERESAIIAAMQAHPSQGAKAVVTEPAKPAAAKQPTQTAAAKKAAADKAAAAKKSEEEAAAKAAAEAEAAEEEVTVDDDEVSVDDVEVGEELTRDEVTEMATDLIGNGSKPKVIASLKAVGAKRVSEVTDEKLAEFAALLQA